MDIRQLKYFIAMADYGSLSQAALKLSVVQSALSHNLAQLEEELGIELFYRHPRGVELTTAGETLYGYANTVLETLSVARDEVSSINSNYRDQIWIGLNYTAMQIVFLPLLKTLADQFSDLKFGLVEDLSATLIEYLIDKKVAIVVAYNPPEDSSLISIPILQERVCCIGSKKFLNNHNTPISLSDVTKIPLILAGLGTNLRGIVNDNKLIKRLKSACFLEINSLSGLILALKEDIGCSILSSTTVQKEIDKGGLIVRPIIEPDVYRGLYVVYQKNAKNALLLNKLANIIKEQIHKNINNEHFDGVLAES